MGINRLDPVKPNQQLAKKKKGLRDMLFINIIIVCIVGLSRSTPVPQFQSSGGLLQKILQSDSLSPKASPGANSINVINGKPSQRRLTLSRQPTQRHHLFPL